jgi:hypothetical protein
MALEFEVLLATDHRSLATDFQPFSVRASARYGVNHLLAVFHTRRKTNNE